MMPLFRSVTAAVMLVIAAPVFAAALEGSTQLVVVTTEGWDATQGKLQAFERTAKGATIVVRYTIEIEGAGKPALVADTVRLLVS